MELSFISFIFLAGIAFFILTHLRPLNKSEIFQLGSKQRDTKIREYFKFSGNEYHADQLFKSQMNPNGKFYKIAENLFDFPSIAAGLLKYKKHEWIIIGFEKDKFIDLLWLNKGPNDNMVSLNISEQEIIKIAKQNRSTSILKFHNHPNSNPNLSDCTQPSDLDIYSACEFARILDEKGINLVEFVCERGIYYEYHKSVSETFLPLSDFIDNLEKINGGTRLINFKLHIERIF